MSEIDTDAFYDGGQHEPEFEEEEVTEDDDRRIDEVRDEQAMECQAQYDAEHGDPLDPAGPWGNP